MADFFIDATSCKPVYASEYLQAFPRRGKLLAQRRLGLDFYRLNDCLCLGNNDGQVLAPVHGHVLPVVFRESGPYPASEVALPGKAARFLAGDFPVVDLDEAAPLFPPATYNIWHWTLESLPKLLLLEEIGYEGPYIVDDNPVVQDSLDMFDIPRERRIFAGPAYRIKHMVLPPQLSGFVLPENMPLVAFLRDKILERVGILLGAKRCYIRRIGRRKILNEAEMLHVLKDFDFEIMVPEDLGLVEQWRYMTNVECSLMAHGANTTLTLAQPCGSAFVEFFSNRYINYSNMQAIRLLRMRYLPLVEELDVSWYPDRTTLLHEHLESGIPADIEVQLVHLRMHLEVLLSGKSRGLP